MWVDEVGDTPRATVVIVNYNGAHLLPPCLDAVRAQDLPAELFRTVVVDNASVDGSVDLLARDYPWVDVIASPTNTGFAGGNNLALRDLRTPCAVLLNNDAVPATDWLRNLLAAFDRPGRERTAVVTGKVVFLPKFVRLTWRTEGFSPGPHDPRVLGARIHRVTVDGGSAAEASVAAVDVTEKVLWERLTFGPEGTGTDRFRWTRPEGDLLVPLPAELAEGTVRISIDVRSEAPKVVAVGVDAGSRPAPPPTEVQVTPDGRTIEIVIPPEVERLDVVNNAGGIVLMNGYGADRGFQEVDRGQYDEPTEVFTGCGNGMAIRTAAGREVGWFDDDFFMYYEDTDLSWRLRRRGWDVWYEPAAVLRHVHSASSKEWSPRWVFHVDRNRLLMLVKDATLGLAVREVLRYPASAASMAVRAAREGWRHRSRPALRPHLLRARVMMSFLRLLPAMLVRRWRTGRLPGRWQTVSRRQLQTWLVERR
jgi:GT2 family glycosyltransferase